MPLGYFGTMISSSIILNQPEHQDQPGMGTAIDRNDSHLPPPQPHPARIGKHHFPALQDRTLVCA